MMRHFTSGATRDLDNNKLEYEGFLSPKVLEKYAKFMHKHRFQADGVIRDADNWQKGIPVDVYKKSLIRHAFQSWGVWRGNEVLDDRGEKVDLEEALCGILFNTMGLLHELE